MAAACTELKIAPESLAFSVFLWAHFFWNLSYCDSCPLPLRITSPGNCSSSRAHSSLRPTPFPRGLQSYCIDYLGGCGCVFAFFSVNTGERSSFVPDFSSPAIFFPLCSSCGFCSRSIFSQNWETLFPPCAGLHWSRTCWSGECTPLASGKPVLGDTAVLWIPARIHRDQRRGDWEKKKGDQEELIEAWEQVCLTKITGTKSCRQLTLTHIISRFWQMSLFLDLVWVVK